MTQINKEELKDLDQFIDRDISAQPLFKRPREVALMQLLKVFEDYVRLGAKGDRSIIKLGVDSIGFAIQWVYKYCKPANQKVEYRTNQIVYDEAYNLLMSAKEYSRVWDYLVMLHRERAVGTREGDVITVVPSNQVTPQQDVADQFISSPDSPEMKLAQSQGEYKGKILSLTKNITYQARGYSKVKYSFTDKTFSELQKYLFTITEPLWELDKEWDFGGYTLGQLREFWVTLVGLVLINYSACLYSGLSDWARDSTVMIKNKGRFIRELARFSRLEVKIVEQIIEDLTFNHELYKAGKKQPDPTYQPIFSLSDNLIVISCSLVNNSNAERNMWDLLSIIRPEIHAKLSSLKEELWIGDLVKKLTGYKLEVFPKISFEFDGEKSDIDLLIYDKKNNFLLGAELKWLISPDRITDVYLRDKELERGMIQAQLAKKWLDTKPDRLLSILKIDKNTLKNTKIQVSVLSKNTLGSSWLPRTIPVLNERLIEWILGDPHKRDLQTLWKVGEEKRFLPILGKHFEEPDAEATFAGIKFISQKFGLRILRVWEAKDIDLKNL